MKLPEGRNPTPAQEAHTAREPEDKFDIIQPLFDDNAQNKLDEVYLKKKEETAKKSQAMADSSAM